MVGTAENSVGIRHPLNQGIEKYFVFIMFFIRYYIVDQLLYLPLILVLRMEVKEVIPHFPTVPADLAADGRLLFSRKSLSN